MHETATVQDFTLGRYTEVSERCRISEATLGDYSYIMQDGAVWCAKIGKFANIAASVRINATKPSRHGVRHCIISPIVPPNIGMMRESTTSFLNGVGQILSPLGTMCGSVTDATILPGVTVGDGAVIGAGAVVSKDVAPYTIVGGVAAKKIRDRFDPHTAERLQRLAWWDWDHAKLRAGLDDFRTLEIQEFLEKHHV